MRFSYARPDPDAHEVAAARAGDPRAFDILVCRHHEALGRFVRARMAPDLDADDIVQEIFVAAWRELASFRGAARFKSWLFGIAVHYCADTARRHRRLRAREALLDDGTNGLPDRVLAPAGFESATVIERIELRRGMADLSEPGRQVLELYYYGGLNLREIGNVLGVNLSTLKYWFYQAHKRLRAALDAPEQPGRKATRIGARR